MRWGGGGGPCNYCASPSPFGVDFGTLDFGTSELGLTIKGYGRSLNLDVLVRGGLGLRLAFDNKQFGGKHFYWPRLKIMH